MKTITSMLVMAVFMYIVYKRRISPLLPGNRKEKAGASGTAARTGDKETSTHPPASPRSHPGYGFVLDPDIRYDVMVLDYSGNGPDAYFADRIDAKLSLAVSEMLEKGYPYRIDFIPFGTALMILVTYRIKPDAAPSGMSPEDAP